MLKLDNEIFETYAFWAGILIAKVMVLSALTAKTRVGKGIFASPEDVALGDKKSKVLQGDPDIERIRRAHLNDLENIIPFLIIGMLYTLTGPSLVVAGLLFKIYGFARILHTFVYAIYVIPQPARALSWLVGYLIQFYMAFQVIVHFY